MLSFSRHLLGKSASSSKAALFSTSSFCLNQAPIDFNKLTIEKTTKPKELLPNDQLVFGQNFTGT